MRPATPALTRQPLPPQDLDIALVKATNHDPVVPKKKHVISECPALRPGSRSAAPAPPGMPSRLTRGHRRPSLAIYNCVGRQESARETIRYALVSLGDRVAGATEWLVVLKALMVVHRLMRDSENDRFRTALAELLFGGRGRDNGERRRDASSAGGPCQLFNLGGFKDDSSPEAWEISGWVRVYALYLEERCALFADCRCDPQAEAPDVPSAARSWSSAALLANLPKLQNLMRRLVDALPRLPRLHPVAAAAAVDTMRETRFLFRAVSDGIINLVDQFFDMPVHEATQALDMYRRAVRQVADLNAALRGLVSHEQLAAEMTKLHLPFDPPPVDFIKVMEDYINSPDAARRAAHVPAAHHNAASAASSGSPPVYNLTPALPPAMPMPAGVGTAAQRQADPFDLLGGLDDPFTVAAPPPLPPHGHHAAHPAPAAPAGGAPVDLFDLLGGPAPAAAAPPPAPVAVAPPPAPVLNKGMLDSLYDSAPHGHNAFGGAPPASMAPPGAHNPFAAMGGMGPPGAMPPQSAYRPQMVPGMMAPPGPYGQAPPGMGPPGGMHGGYGAPPPPSFYGAPAAQPPPMSMQPGGYGGGWGAPPAPPASAYGGGMGGIGFGGLGAPQQQQQQPQMGMQGFGMQPPQGGMFAQQARPPPPSTNPFA
jgi:hypothetical protein